MNRPAEPVPEAERVAIVTGSAQGIGRAVADEFARRRLRVVINDLDADRAEQAASQLRSAGSDAIAAAGSVCDKSCMQRMAADAKAGVLGLTRHLSREVARQGITVNAVCPGLIDTEMVRATIATDAVQRYAASFPVARLGRPAEVASLVAFLASDDAAYITGASLDINGGDLTV